MEKELKDNEMGLELTDEILLDSLDIKTEEKIDRILANQKEIKEELQNIKNLVEYNKHVTKEGKPRKKVGAKRMQMFFDGLEITDEQLFDLVEDIGILKTLSRFCYINNYDEYVTDKVKCRSFINNRLRNKQRGCL